MAKYFSAFLLRLPYRLLPLVLILLVSLNAFCQCSCYDPCVIYICVVDECVIQGSVNCDDGNACTSDYCDPVNGCQNTFCNDYDACTSDVCDPVNGCFYNYSCNDNNACTYDYCY